MTMELQILLSAFIRNNSAVFGITEVVFLAQLLTMHLFSQQCRGSGGCKSIQTSRHLSVSICHLSQVLSIQCQELFKVHQINIHGCAGVYLMERAMLWEQISQSAFSSKVCSTQCFNATLTQNKQYLLQGTLSNFLKLIYHYCTFLESINISL